MEAEMYIKFYVATFTWTDRNVLLSIQPRRQPTTYSSISNVLFFNNYAFIVKFRYKYYANSLLYFDISPVQLATFAIVRQLISARQLIIFHFSTFYCFRYDKG